ncbi:MAG: type IV pilus assembly protein PilM [Myxococcales bacterium]|nr:type IV pilus assembly protein PilM [Myxococcales bacterium]
MAKGRMAVGLDIGSGSIKLCQLKPAKRGNYQLQAFGMVQLPPEAIVDGALMNSTAVVDGIQELFASQKIKHKQVATSVSGHSVIIKKISLPQMTPEELEESIQWEAEQYIPFDINDVNIDVQILNTESTQAGQMDVLLVAAKKDMVNDYTEVIQTAGLEPVVVDIDAFAVQNQFEINYEVPRAETVVLINIGASVTNINVLASGVSSFTRDISVGGNQFTDAVQKALNVSYDEAEALKLGGSGAESDAVVPQEVERVLQSESESIANEIQRSLDFYSATSADSHIARIFLSGGSAKIPALVKTIQNRTNHEVEVINPFRNIDTSSTRFDPTYLSSVAPMSCVAVGLALRRPADR